MTHLVVRRGPWCYRLRGMSTRLPILGPVAAPAPPAASAAPLPTVQALQKLWERLRQRPLWMPPHFWRYMALRRRTHLRLLDPDRVRLAVPVGKVNDCGCCNDICCVGPRSTVLLRLRDIATLMDVGRTDLIAADKPAFSAAELSERPALRRHVASTAWQTFPVLRQNNLRACAALTTEGKCSLYPYWPLSCARFPYSLHLDDEEVFYSQRCDSYWVHPDLQPLAQCMARLAVDGYNERIKDLVLLEYASDELRALGISRFLGGELSPGE